MDEGLEDGAYEKDRPHRRGAPSEPVQIQRYQDGQCAEKQGGEPYEPQAGKQQGLAYRSERRQQGDITGGNRCLLQGGLDGDDPAHDGDESEGWQEADGCCDAAKHRPEERSDHGRADHHPDHLGPPLLRGPVNEPGERRDP